MDDQIKSINKKKIADEQKNNFIKFINVMRKPVLFSALTYFHNFFWYCYFLKYNIFSPDNLAIVCTTCIFLAFKATTIVPSEKLMEVYLTLFPVENFHDFVSKNNKIPYEFAHVFCAGYFKDESENISKDINHSFNGAANLENFAKNDDYIEQKQLQQTHINDAQANNIGNISSDALNNNINNNNQNSINIEQANNICTTNTTVTNSKIYTQPEKIKYLQDLLFHYEYYILYTSKMDFSVKNPIILIRAYQEQIKNLMNFDNENDKNLFIKHWTCLTEETFKIPLLLRYPEIAVTFGALKVVNSLFNIHLNFTSFYEKNSERFTNSVISCIDSCETLIQPLLLNPQQIERINKNSQENQVKNKKNSIYYENNKLATQKGKNIF